ncbi:MAG: ABC transporter substrate-binding protein [Alphaproteobacteria bacterium]|nr:ABC transporter substrate-binding protein [Alphaproteobacteria bacterium]
MKDALKAYLPVAVVALVLVVIAMRFIAPAPPKVIRFAAGGADGQYYAYGEQYRDALGVHGVKVEVLETPGTVENYRLLLAGEADVALLQGGLADEAARAETLSLGGMFAEPFWIFVPSEAETANFGDLHDKLIAMGGDGSGTRALAQRLQADWGGAWRAGDPRSGSQAAAALLAGEVDAAVFAAAVDAPYVQALLKDARVRLVPVPRAQGISMHYPALAPVTLYEGVVDLDSNRPGADTPLIAAIAQLGVRADTHPAIQAVLLEAAETIHGGNSILTRAGTFPDANKADLPLSDEARRFYRNGPTFLRRYFSFGTANFLERAWILVIPLITLLIPLVQVAPPVYRWRIRRRIYVWYNDLHELERRGIDATDNATRHAVLEEIQALQHEVGKVDVPVSYNDELYHLRSHINFVEALVARQKTQQA